MRLFVFLLILCSCCSDAYAQPPVATRCYNLYVKGLAHLSAKQYDKAEKALNKSIQCNSSYVNAFEALSDVYLLQQEYLKAAEVLERASSVCAGCRQSYALKLAKSLCRAGLYEAADQALNRWPESAKRNEHLEREYHFLRNNIQFGRSLKGKPETNKPENLGFRVNTGYDEYFPSISPDDTTLIFTHRSNGMDEDFYRSRRDSCGGWFLARDMGFPLNSVQQESAHMRSADGRYLFFMRCGNRSLGGWDGGGCDLYFSYTEPEEWSQPVRFGATINTPGFEGMPSLSVDNMVLYFVSDREGGFGGKDIWMSRFEQGAWQIPENLGPTINTPFDETAPNIAADNNTLYFTSNGHPGLGGNDIFYVRKDEKGVWQRPENMGYPFNSAYEDVSMIVSADGQKAYYSSDRPGGIGGLDLYEIILPLEARPAPVTYVYGTVYDSLSKVQLPYASIEFYDAESNELLYQYQGNRGDASYMAAVAVDKEMYLKVFRTGYWSHEDTLYFEDIKAARPDTFQIALLPSNYWPPTSDTLLTTLWYSPKETLLSDSLLADLACLVQPYVGKRFMEFIIKGVVYNVANPAMGASMSYERAAAITELLVSIGGDPYYIHTEGGGNIQSLPSFDSSSANFQPGVEIILRKP